MCCFRFDISCVSHFLSLLPLLQYSTMLLPDMGISGVLHFSLKSGVKMPYDWFEYKVDNITKFRWFDPMVEFQKETIEIPQGQHLVEFEYVFNPQNTSLEFVPVYPNRTGVVYLDDVYFVPTPPCDPLLPNPYDFEEVSFPVSPWSTTGEGDNLWSLTDDKAYSGITSLRSPLLEGGKAESNATLQVCDTDLDGGYLRQLQFQVIASVQPPLDIFIVSIDGETAAALVNVSEWRKIALALEPGPHTIDFSYQFNLVGDDLDNYTSPTEREGEYEIVDRLSLN